MISLWMLRKYKSIACKLSHTLLVLHIDRCFSYLWILYTQFQNHWKQKVRNYTLKYLLLAKLDAVGKCTSLYICIWICYIKVLILSTICIISNHKAMKGRLSTYTAYGTYSQFSHFVASRVWNWNAFNQDSSFSAVYDLMTHFEFVLQRTNHG